MWGEKRLGFLREHKREGKYECHHSVDTYFTANQGLYRQTPSATEPFDRSQKDYSHATMVVALLAGFLMLAMGRNASARQKSLVKCPFLSQILLKNHPKTVEVLEKMRRMSYRGRSKGVHSVDPWKDLLEDPFGLKNRKVVER